VKDPVLEFEECKALCDGAFGDGGEDDVIERLGEYENG
jgi:hypothetical protein